MLLKISLYEANTYQQSWHCYLCGALQGAVGSVTELMAVHVLELCLLLAFVLRLECCVHSLWHSLSRYTVTKQNTSQKNATSTKLYGFFKNEGTNNLLYQTRNTNQV